MEAVALYEDIAYHDKMADMHSNASAQHEKEVTNGGHDDHDYASFDHDAAQKAHKEAASAHKQHGPNSSQYKAAASKASDATETANDATRGLKFKKVSRPKLSD
jgi:hypothetical protein